MWASATAGRWTRNLDTRSQFPNHWWVLGLDEALIPWISNQSLQAYPGRTVGPMLGKYRNYLWTGEMPPKPFFLPWAESAMWGLVSALPSWVLPGIHQPFHLEKTNRNRNSRKPVSNGGNVSVALSLFAPRAHSKPTEEHSWLARTSSVSSSLCSAVASGSWVVTF